MMKGVERLGRERESDARPKPSDGVVGVDGSAVDVNVDSYQLKKKSSRPPKESLTKLQDRVAKLMIRMETSANNAVFKQLPEILFLLLLDFLVEELQQLQLQIMRYLVMVLN